MSCVIKRFELKKGMKSRAITGRLEQIQGRRLLILTGARQTGKTTLARWKYPDLPYINLDAVEYRDMLRAVSSFQWGRDVGAAILDEAQKEPSVFDKVKFAYDDRQIDFSILLGSSQILLLKKVRESLAGRAFVMELWPLMLCELVTDAPAGIGSPLLSDLIRHDLATVLNEAPGVKIGPEALRADEAEAHLLRWGGMPELLELTHHERIEWLRSYEITYLERDLGDLARMDDLQPFKKFQKLASLRSGCLLNYSELARDASVSVDTSRRYLEYLRISYQALLLQPWRTNVTSTLVKTPKLYWVDMGLLRHLTGMGDGVTGNLYENYVVTEIWKWCKTVAERVDLYFYRTRSGMEIDLILEIPKGLIGLKIKSRERVVRSDATALRSFGEAIGERWLGGMVVYRGNKIAYMGDKIWAVPSSRLLSSNL